MAIELKDITLRGSETGSLSLHRGLLSLRRRDVSRRERMFFIERLALLLETGGTLSPSLQVIKRQVDNPELCKMIDDLDKDIQDGKSFSQALSRHPKTFSSTYVNLIRASEHGGFIGRALNELHAMELRSEKLRNNLIMAFSYPAFLLSFSMIVVIFILTAVFPKFASLFASIYDQLPLTTRMLMGLSETASRFWWLWLALLGSFTMIAIRGLRSAVGREFVDRLKLSTPGIRSIFIEVYLVQTLRILSLSLANGVPIIEALHSCRNIADNRIFQRFLVQQEKLVKEGKKFAEGFMESPIIPPMVHQTILTGEESGQLSLVMERIAAFYEKTLERRLTMISKIAEPLLLLFMGIIVGVLVASLILPIFKLSRAVR